MAVVAVIMTLMGPGTPETYPLLIWASRALVAAVAILVTVRYGLLALAALTLTELTFNKFPVTLDPAVWYFDRSLLGLALIAGLAVFGFIRALGTEALFGRPVLED